MTALSNIKTAFPVQVCLRLFLLLMLTGTVFASQGTPLKQDITDIPLEELMNMKVSTVARKTQKSSDTPAAVFVISQEDIRRSSANSIPELLRMAPGLSVARIDGNKWSVTSRGDSSRFADDLLVMVDGRSVFSPLFAGTFWETLDMPLEDIDRIEVIRGPSGTIWGANAANGSIHIITKRAKDTQGSLVTLGGGTEERGFTTLRHGGKIGENLHFRIFSKGFSRDNSYNPAGTNDSTRMGTVGFRADWDINPNNAVTFQGQYYGGKAGQNTLLTNPLSPEVTTPRIEDANMTGGNALVRWQRTTGERSNSVLQAYYDHTKRDELSFRESRQTVDVDFQHRFPLTMPLSPDIVWGGGYRWTGDQTGINLPISFDPARREIQTGNVFVQSDMQLIEERLKLSTGIKYLHNTYIHGKFLPNFRLLWTPDPKQSVWAAATNALRIPSRFEFEGRQFNKDGAEFIRHIGNPQILAETLWSFETGYKRQLTSDLSFDLAAFFNRYNNSETAHIIGSNLVQSTSDGKADVYGFELFGNWRVLNRLRFIPNYSYLRVNQYNSPGLTTILEEIADPKHQFTFRSQLDLTHNVELDAFFRYIDKLPGSGIASYKTLDFRVAWRPAANVELSVIGQNLLQSRHQEFLSDDVIYTTPIQIQRGVFGKLTVRF